MISWERLNPDMTPTFEFFENVCEELGFSDEAVLPDDDLLSPEQLEDLRSEYDEVDPAEGVPRALTALENHFGDHGGALPFSYDLDSRTYHVVDRTYLDFLLVCISIRGSRADSREFEVSVTQRLSLRAIGAFHRVGWPRENGEPEAFNAYLSPLGFEDVNDSYDKDSGLDILWVPLLGALPYRPIMTFQCKNGSYDLVNALASNGAAQMSLNTHRTLDPCVHTTCVVFNDYIEPSILSRKKQPFVPLGLSDLCDLIPPERSVAIL